MNALGDKLLTAEEFFHLPIDGAELVQGRVVVMPPPGWKHGRIGFKLNVLLGVYLEAHNIGRGVTLDAGIVTRRNPDSVRGADLGYYSYARLPAKLRPNAYPAISPEIVWEVLSPDDRWKAVEEKAREYLQAGVLVVCVIDPRRRCFVTYYPDRPEEMLPAPGIWTAAEILPGFEIPATELFEDDTE